MNDSFETKIINLNASVSAIKLILEHMFTPYNLIQDIDPDHKIKSIISQNYLNQEISQIETSNKQFISLINDLKINYNKLNINYDPIVSNVKF